MRCPPDGDCLFHAIGLHIGVPSSRLRRACANAFEEETEERRQLMCIDEVESSEEYSRKMRDGSLFGGHNEMMFMSNIYGVRINVYAKGEDGRLVKITTVSPNTRSERVRTVANILYNGRDHYDSLLEV